jgi:archaellum biogenesis ATPase FlaH
MERIERTTLKNLIHNDEYARKVLPFLKEEYFTERFDKILFREIYHFITKYNNLPTKEALSIELNNRKDVNETEYKTITDILGTLNKEQIDQKWLVETTEKFCKDRAIHNAILGGIQILDGKDKSHSPEYLPEMLSQALSVSFDQKIGHDYLTETKERYDFYRRKEERLELDLEFFNKITRGGIPSKTLNICLAGTGVGKTMFMTHLASSILLQGKNVLYITLEMAEERIAERIDANLLNVGMSDLEELPYQMYETKINKLQSKTTGKLIIKEYPTASAHTGHFKNLLNELALKKSFKPDILFVDYLNIAASARFKAGANVNSYTYIKAIAEELRGLAVEYNIPVFSATQTTRGGYVSSDVGMEDTAESFGLPATADFMFALISSEELEQKNQILIKQLKNRYNDPTVNRKFIVGVDRSKMRLYDVEQKAQEDLVDTGQEDQLSTSNKFKKLGEFSDFKI